VERNRKVWNDLVEKAKTHKGLKWNDNDDDDDNNNNNVV
jgi:hypothetical protein